MVFFLTKSNPGVSKCRKDTTYQGFLNVISNRRDSSNTYVFPKAVQEDTLSITPPGG